MLKYAISFERAFLMRCFYMKHVFNLKLLLGDFYFDLILPDMCGICLPL